MPLIDSEEFNKSFVRSVEKFPALYNLGSDDYSNKVEQDRAWKDLSKKFNTSENECKKRWRNLRTAYVRHMKKKYSTISGVKKSYYLSDLMHFILPHIKPRSGPFPTVIKTELDNYFSESEELREDATLEAPDADCDDSQRDVLPPSSQDATFPIYERKWPHPRPSLPSEEPEMSAIPHHSLETDDEKNPDLYFFKSILPDIADFSPAIKRRFKQRVLQLIDELDAESPSSVPPPNTSEMGSLGSSVPEIPSHAQDYPLRARYLARRDQWK